MPIVGWGGETTSYADDNTDAMSLCKTKGNDYTLPTLAEAISMNFNFNNFSNVQFALTGTVTGAGSAGKVWLGNILEAKLVPRTQKNTVWCVKE